MLEIRRVYAQAGSSMDVRKSVKIMGVDWPTLEVPVLYYTVDPKDPVVGNFDFHIYVYGEGELVNDLLLFLGRKGEHCLFATLELWDTAIIDQETRMKLALMMDYRETLWNLRVSDDMRTML